MEKSKSIIFYSWQSDLENKTNRGFIEQALKDAVKAIRNDDTIEVEEPALERDTQDVPGSPDIVKTIFEKIKRAKVFVCDVSIINQGAKRLAPNPNVVAEWGYALGVLGEERIIMVLNTAYGKQEDLPFDLRQRRAIGYYMPKDMESEDQSRTAIRKNLASGLKTAILAILKLDEPQPAKVVSLAEQATIAIKDNRRDQHVLIQDYMNDLAEKIPLITPAPNSSNREIQEHLIHVLRDSIARVVEFAQLVKISAGLQADEVIRGVYQSFARILDVTVHPNDFQGIPEGFTHDSAKFLGHELFVILFSFLMRNERWDLIAGLIDEKLSPQNARFGYSGAPFHLLSENPYLLYEQGRDHLRKNIRSLHADLLNERHTNGELARIVPMEHFMGADFLLFLCSPLTSFGSGQAKQPTWMPWSSVYMQDMPRFLQEAIHVEKAQRLVNLLKVEDIPSLRAKLQEYKLALGPAWGTGPMLPLHYAFRKFDFDTIGSQSARTGSGSRQ